MSRYQFFVRYALPYILGLMGGGIAMGAAQRAGAPPAVAGVVWLVVAVAIIGGWVLLRRALAARARTSSVVNRGGMR